MHAQRQAFLDEVRADLATADRPEMSRPRKITKRVGIAGSVAAASIGLLAAAAGPVQASPAPQQSSGVSTMSSCDEPDPIDASHSKWCGAANFVFDYRGYTAAGPHICYHFDLTIYSMACWFPNRTLAGGRQACDS